MTDPLALGVAVAGMSLGGGVCILYFLGYITYLFAEAGVPSNISADWIQYLGGMTSLGFAVWYAWYTTTVIIPNKDRQHAETISKIVDTNAEAMNRAMSEFRAEVREQREAFSKRMDR